MAIFLTFVYYVVLCPKMPVADKKALFLRLAKVEKVEFTGVSNSFEGGRNEKKWRFFVAII
ncbi:hypothetical protein ACT3CD_09830 [Geofilum sp. OHC36d9]|uniref:hypothetical protein n=1 Tax=Geofilum sp. OHC36d9 TaxID=3458413 RepID=UPI004033FA63